MSNDDHERFIERIQRLDGKVLLSGYPNDIYRKLSWKCLETEVRATSTPPDQRDGVREARTEAVWMNYDPLFIKGWGDVKRSP